MNIKFRLGKTVYLIIIFVLIIGLLLSVLNSNYMLSFLPNGGILDIHTDEENVKKLTEETIRNLETEEYLLIYNDKNSYSVFLKDNIIRTLDYMKKETDVVTLDNVPVSFDKYKNIIIAFEEIGQLNHLSVLEAYVAEGGKVFFAIRPEINGSLENLYRKLGIYEIGEFINPDGMELTSNVLVKSDHLVMKKEEIAENSSLSVGLEDRCTIYAKSIDQIPLLWDVSYREGKFMVFNGSILGTKENRGLISGALSMLNETYIYPVMNMKITYIDDFPAPVPEGRNEQIYDEYQRDIPSFYRDIWWPDMLKMAAKYDVKYTGLVIQTYDDKITPPYKTKEQQRNNFIQYGRELLKMGGEIGIHGYNHQSLTVNTKAVKDLGYNAWKNQKDMEGALNTTEDYMKELFPNYDMKTYVPPSNRIDEVGKAALHNAIPSINTISSLYLTDDIEYTTVQEFEKAGVFLHLPRITSGYHYTNKMEWIIANGVTSLGVFSHFIHPDDVLDEQRSSNKKWSELGKEYDQLLHHTYTNYPWLQSMVAKEASNKLANYLAADIYIKEKDNRVFITIDRFAGEMNFLFRTKKKIADIENCEIQKIDKDVYLVKAEQETIEIGLGN
ncbi:DUF2194 domain-containing protein [Metabacillus fastidiosus]|uniref:DUF2194 domain-containing protein n=1 Tax=Metabacillus fastidiosus TaxID=1458 RepID=UPI003D2A110A